VAARRSRLLYVAGTPLVPPKIGPARRNYHVVEQLSRFFDVTVAAFGEPSHELALRAAIRSPLSHVTLVAARPSPSKFVRKLWHTARGRCDYLPAYDAGLRSTCIRLAADARFDAVVVSSLLLGRLGPLRGVPVVADTHNVEYDVHRRVAETADGVFRRAYARRQSAITRACERRCGRAVDLVLATSDRDRRLFETDLQLENVVVVPNGVDISEFRPASAPSARPTIIFTGLMSWYPNAQGVRWFLDAVLPRVVRRVGDVRFMVAGAAPPAWLLNRRGSHVEVIGAVPDMRPYLALARAAVVPLKIGGGTRVKILEAQAMAKPVVSTVLGAEGLDQRHGASILLANDAAEFADAVITVLTDDDTAARLGSAGREYVRSHFEWNEIGRSLASTLEQRLGLVARSGAVPQNTPAC
jgi:glycosyltransferase involved in cell wall biosynthesis